MRFIFNFIFFGLLFFLISRFLPDTFETLVGWVGHLYDFLKEVVLQIVEWVQAAFSRVGNGGGNGGEGV